MLLLAAAMVLALWVALAVALVIIKGATAAVRLRNRRLSNRRRLPVPIHRP